MKTLNIICLMLLSITGCGSDKLVFGNLSDEKAIKYAEDNFSLTQNFIYLNTQTFSAGEFGEFAVGGEISNNGQEKFYFTRKFPITFIGRDSNREIIARGVTEITVTPFLASGESVPYHCNLNKGYPYAETDRISVGDFKDRAGPTDIALPVNRIGGPPVGIWETGQLANIQEVYFPDSQKASKWFGVQIETLEIHWGIVYNQ